jgi:hypothetical protein
MRLMRKVMPKTWAVVFLAACACKESSPAGPVDAGLPPAPPPPSASTESVPVVAQPPPELPPPPPYGDGGAFEGEIDLKTTVLLNPPPTTSQVLIKGSQLAIVTTIRGAKPLKVRYISRLEEGRRYEVSDTKQTYEGYAMDTVTPDIAVKHTGKSERIAGAACDDWSLTSSDGAGRACVARGLGPYYLPGPTFPAALWAPVLAHKGYFALRASNVNPDGKDLVIVEVTRIVPRPIPDDVFVIPSTYQDAEVLEQQEAKEMGDQ